MKVYIRTCSKESEMAILLAQKMWKDAEFVWVDRDIKKWGLDKGDYKIISNFQMYRELEVGDCIIVPAKYYNKIFIDEIKSASVDLKQVYIYIENQFVNGEQYAYLEYLEYHVADHCNLNCRGCSHFCPLVRDEIYPDYEVFKMDLYRLKELIPHIHQIRIMGGEPLLNQQLDRFVDLTRAVYAESDIRLVTNGLLLKNVDAKVWESLKKNKIKIDISMYPAVVKRVDEYIELILKNNVEIGSLHRVTTFDPVIKQKSEFEFDNISSCKCNNLRDGCIASCQLVFYGKYFNDYYKKDIPFESGKICLQDVKTGKELVELLNKPFELCKECNNYLVGINQSDKGREWRQRKKITECQIEDWMKN